MQVRPPPRCSGRGRSGPYWRIPALDTPRAASAAGGRRGRAAASAGKGRSMTLTMRRCTRIAVVEEFVAAGSQRADGNDVCLTGRHHLLVVLFGVLKFRRSGDGVT